MRNVDEQKVRDLFPKKTELSATFVAAMRESTGNRRWPLTLLQGGKQVSSREGPPDGAA